MPVTAYIAAVGASMHTVKCRPVCHPACKINILSKQFGKVANQIGLTNGLPILDLILCSVVPSQARSSRQLPVACVIFTWILIFGGINTTEVTHRKTYV